MKASGVKPPDEGAVGEMDEIAVLSVMASTLGRGDLRRCEEKRGQWIAYLDLVVVGVTDFFAGEKMLIRKLDNVLADKARAKGKAVMTDEE
jgi:hypothetical protein